MKEVLVPFAASEIELMEKRSRFIGRVFPISSEEEAKDQLDRIRQKHRDANHNVYCYLVRGTNTIRYSDDGEPQGTAGLPVLNVFSKEEVTGLLCTVTRYFGGTLLGAGGLTRAYAACAKSALDAAGICVLQIWQALSMTCAYPQYERLHKLALEQGAQVAHSDFGACVTISLSVPQGQTDAFVAYMTNASSGGAGFTLGQLEEVPVRLS